MPATNDSILNSIKGRIWVAAGALAVIDCFCGLGAYLAVSFLVADAFVTIFVTVFLLAFLTMIFGWWLSNDVVRPIDAVTLLAKALERSPNATLPRTTGAVETDELLRTLHRNSQQLQNLISMMDEVAAGRTDVVRAPLENSDRLSASFQKLVSRVSDSISAKRELDELRAALICVNTDIAGIRGGRLDAQVRTEHPLTKEIADTIRYLSGRLDRLARGVRMGSAGAASAAAEAKRVIRNAFDARDDRSARLARGISAVRELPVKAENIVRETGSAIAAFESSIDGAAADEHRDGIGRAAELNARIAETAKKVQKLRARIAELPQIGRAANEIARKSNLIALNTSIQSEDAGAAASSFALLLNEVSSLSRRADALNKEIRTLSETLTGEVGDLSGAFGAIASASSETARGIDRAAQKLEDFRNRSGELASTRKRLFEFASEQAPDNQRIHDLVDAISEDRGDETQLREAEMQLQKLITLVENLGDSVTDLQVGSAQAFGPAGDGSTGQALPFERVATDQIGVPGENQ